MNTFAQELTIMRRFLRDPDGDIWSSEDLRTYWNDALMELAAKAGYMERADAYSYPPKWTFSYMQDWEYAFTDGDRYQCFTNWQARNVVVCFPWESGYWLTNSDTADDGTRFTHPWESVYSSPADHVPIPLHARFHRCKFVAFDEDGITPTDRTSLASRDRFYKTASGTPLYYWRPDEESNQIVLYPRPSSVTWDDNSLLSNPFDSLSDTEGIKTYSDEHLDYQDAGIVTDTINTVGQIFMVFEAIPQEVPSDPGSWYDSLDWPDFLSKYVRYGALERAFGADTDGFIPSLRDYWNTRKEVGIKAIKRFKTLRLTDRTFRLGGGRTIAKSRHPRLPNAYPAQYP